MRREYNTNTGGGVLPAGYAELDYIESTGSQYIITNIIGKSGISVEAYLSNTEVPSDKIFIGSRTNSGNRVLPIAFNRNKTTYPTINIGYNDYKYSTFQIVTYTFYKIKTVLNVGLQTIKVNDVEVFRSTNYSSVNNNFPLFIFCCNNNGTPMYYSYTRLKKIIIERNGNVELNMIPALRVSDNKPGLYDLCNTTCPLTGTPFYINAGSGNFLYQLK